MAIKEEGSVYGVCFIDTSLGTFHVSVWCVCLVTSSPTHSWVSSLMTRVGLDYVHSLHTIPLLMS